MLLETVGPNCTNQLYISQYGSKCIVTAIGIISKKILKGAYLSQVSDTGSAEPLVYIMFVNKKKQLKQGIEQ